MSSLAGKSISNKGQTSTSPLYDASFASLDDYDTVFEIYAPQGSRGSYIAELSSYDKIEQEVLLNPNDLYIMNVQTGVVDKNGRTKNVLKALALSKDRECYKGISQQQAQWKGQIYEQIMNQEYSQNVRSTNLPIRKNRFSKFFNQLRSRFARMKKQEQRIEGGYIGKVSSKTQFKEKKSWELEADDKTRIQKETAEIAQKYREQGKQQKIVQKQPIGDMEL